MAQLALVWLVVLQGGQATGRAKHDLSLAHVKMNCWAVDDRTARLLNVLDDFNREGYGIEIYFSRPAERVIPSVGKTISKIVVCPFSDLNRMIEWRGKPETLWVDTGADFISGILLEWTEKQGITITHEWLDQHSIETIVLYGDCRQPPTGQGEHRISPCNGYRYTNDCPNIPRTVGRQAVAGQRGIGGIPPAMKLKMPA